MDCNMKILAKCLSHVQERNLLETEYSLSLFFLQEIVNFFLLAALRAILCLIKGNLLNLWYSFD